jgi:hypothetical protein
MFEVINPENVTRKNVTFCRKKLEVENFMILSL